jgi:apolipoprotein N-acyltransferase
MQIAVFGVPFFVTAWLLWVKPKIGAIVLMLMGIGFGILMFSWIRSGTIDQYIIVQGSFILVPFALGLFTLIREMNSERRK